MVEIVLMIIKINSTECILSLWLLFLVMKDKQFWMEKWSKTYMTGTEGEEEIASLVGGKPQ